MALAQFVVSIRRILRARHLNRCNAIARHLGWQLRRMIGAFPVTLRLSNSWISDDSSAGVLPLVNALGAYDYNNMSLFAECLLDGGTFLDIGANIGPYTLLLSENARVEVVSFEPNPSAFAKLKANVELNRRMNVTLMNVALSSSDGELVMTNEGSSATNKIVTAAVAGSVTVPSKRLQKFLESQSRRQPVIAKVDVEGHEVDVLMGAGAALAIIQIIALEELPGATFGPLMHSYGFEGPYYADALERRLSRNRPPFSEDGIFFSDRGRLLASRGWRIDRD
jgi:FkbM family methyltransferase